MSSPSNFTPEQHTPTAMTTTNPIIVTINNHGFAPGSALRATRFVKYPIADATGMEQLNNGLYYVQQPTTNTFGLYDINAQPIDGTNFTPFINNGLAQFTLTGPNLVIENPAPPPPS